MQESGGIVFHAIKTTGTHSRRPGMQNSTQPAARDPRLFAMPSSGKPPRQIALYRLACPAVNLSRAARRQPSADRNRASMSIPHAFKASPVEGRATRQCNAASTARHKTRRNGSMQRDPTPDSPVHAAPGKLCEFAQNRAVQALQVRPISNTRNALQELYAAISNDLAAFRLTPGSAAQGIPDRPPGIDPLRLYADGVKFSQNFR